MRESRRQLLVLIEQKPRFVRELAAATGMRAGAILDALREFKALGIVEAKPVRVCGVGHAAPKVYGRAGVDLSAFA